MKNRACMIIFAMILSLGMQAQTFQIRGKVSSDNPAEPLPFVTVTGMLDSSIIQGAVTDLDGKYAFNLPKAGKYTLKISTIGYEVKTIKNVKVIADSATVVNVMLTRLSNTLNQVVVSDYKVPLIDKGQSCVQSTVVVNSICSMQGRVAGVNSPEKGKKIKVRGSRSDQTNYYVDGIKIADCNAIPRRRAKVGGTDNEEYGSIVENEFLNAKKNPLSTFSIDVDAASYSNIRRFINGGSFPPKDAVRIEEMINYFAYKYHAPKADLPISINTVMSSCPWNADHKLIKVNMSGKDIPVDHLPSNNLVFLIDVSGSMSSEDKLPLLKRSFRLLVEQLRKEDLVSIVVYAGNAGLVLPATSGEKKEEILAAIERLEAGGSTAGGAGIELAYKIALENFIKGGNNRVILATDGDFNVGVHSASDLTTLIERKRKDGVFLTTLGFGTGNYKDATMELLADKGNGNAAYIDNINEAHKVFVKEMGATLNTIAKDVKLQIEFNPAKVKAYRLIGYENRILAKEDFNNDAKDAGEIGSGHHVTAFYEIIPAGSKEQVDGVDSLKYQKVIESESSASNETMTIKVRFKDPGASKSKLIIHAVSDENIALENTDDDFRFAAAVAEFGMLLRDSKFKGKSNLKSVLALAKEAKGIDEDGYRTEFIHLVEKAEIISGSASIKR